jgi:methylamine dehydrogenase heavy chain
MRRVLAAFAFAALAAPPAVAQLSTKELTTEELNVVELKDRLQPHWVWVNDISFTHLSDGKAFLIDADTGQFLGMISGGFAHSSLQILPDGSAFAVPGTYMSRHSRGTRTDVVTFYDTRTLKPGEEVEIPAKRMASVAFLAAMPVSDDGRFSLIYNFTPEQSVTVVDMAAKKFVGEYMTAGCGLIFPTGPRSFMMPCADGSFQGATLDENGTVTLDGASKPLFEEKDPALEKAVRVSSTRWLFFTPSNNVVAIEAKGKVPTAAERWKLTDATDGNWRIGGIQPVAFHEPSGRLFVLMHEGGAYTHKDPGTEIWVFDVHTHKRLARFPLDKPALSIAVSGDDTPLLYQMTFGVNELIVSDPATGKVLRTIGDLGHEMTLIQPAPVAMPVTRATRK